LLRSDILSGQLPGGSRLGETHLAELYGFSRTPIRESFRRLQAEGLIEVSPHRGARIVDWKSLDIASISELRALVEGYVVRTAATRIEEADLTLLEGLCTEMEAMTDQLNRGDASVLERLTEVNVEFHNHIAVIAGGERMVTIRRAVVAMPLVYRTVHDFGNEDRIRSNQHHRELIDALRARDAEWAAAVMVTHVHAAKVHLMRDQQRLVATGEARSSMTGKPGVE
jgi:DNA-binding GntR family transcriptional regulator